MKTCLYCGKELSNNRGKFCCRSCAATYNNLSRKTTTKGKQKMCKCIVCGEQFLVSIHIGKNKFKCDKCKKHNRPHSKNVNSILDCSKRTVGKILKRAGVGCSICGWNESTCDIHHIIPREDGGSNDNSNLIIICPNCHRICHTTSKYDIKFLQGLSIDKVFPLWKDYYHQSN